MGSYLLPQGKYNTKLNIINKKDIDIIFSLYDTKTPLDILVSKISKRKLLPVPAELLYKTVWFYWADVKSYSKLKILFINKISSFYLYECKTPLGEVGRD